MGRLTSKLVSLDQTITELKEQGEKYVEEISDIKGRYDEEISDIKGRYEEDISDLKAIIAQYENTIVEKNVLVTMAQEEAANANQRLK